MSAYQNLTSIYSEIMKLRGAIAMLRWDDAVMLPPSSYDARSEQIATLESLQHAILTDETTKELIDEAKENEKLKTTDRRTVELIERDYQHHAAIPDDLLKSHIKAAAQCEHQWRKSRAENDFKSLIKPLKNVIQLTSEIADIKAEVFNRSPYEALLDQYDADRRLADITPIFERLKKELPPMIDQAIEKQKKGTKTQSIKESFDKDRQHAFAKEIAAQIGFNAQKGRIDQSSHPFCGGTPDDVRITSRYDESDPLSGIMAICHESGHAMYEQQLPGRQRYEAIGQSLGMSMHEGQSLLIEMQACRSKAFTKYLSSAMKDHFGVKGTSYSAANLYRLVTKVERSLIRVDADEMTYPLHVILRFDLEQALLNEDLLVKDLPDAWNQAMQQYFGITPDSDANGCMQDIHWMDGSIGYFPTYTLGAMTACQLFSAAKKAEPEIEKNLEKGDFSLIKRWLGLNVHKYGSRYDANSLLEKATGETLNVEPFLAHLKSRYLT